MGMDFQEKLNLLGAAAGDEVACQTCAANPQASVVTHHATRPIAASEIQTRTKDLKPWLSSAIRSDGKRISIVKNAHGTNITYIFIRAGLQRFDQTGTEWESDKC